MHRILRRHVPASCGISSAHRGTGGAAADIWWAYVPSGSWHAVFQLSGMRSCGCLPFRQVHRLAVKTTVAFRACHSPVRRTPASPLYSPPAQRLLCSNKPNVRRRCGYPSRLVYATPLQLLHSVGLLIDFVCITACPAALIDSANAHRGLRSFRWMVLVCRVPFNIQQRAALGGRGKLFCSCSSGALEVTSTSASQQPSSGGSRTSPKLLKAAAPPPNLRRFSRKQKLEEFFAAIKIPL